MSHWLADQMTIDLHEQGKCGHVGCCGIDWRLDSPSGVSNLEGLQGG